MTRTKAPTPQRRLERIVMRLCLENEMCTEARVLKGDAAIECATLGELAAALGMAISDVPKFGDFRPEPDDCLCAVHWGSLPGSRRATDEEGWPFPEYIIKPHNTGLSCRPTEEPL